MDLPNLAGLIVAVIAALSAYAAQHSAAKTSLANIGATSRVEMEKDAYNRARGFDTETIRRQDVELIELRATNTNLNKEVEALRLRITRLEKSFPPKIKEVLDGPHKEVHFTD